MLEFMKTFLDIRVIFAGLLGTVVFLVLGIILTVIAAKFKLFVRRNKYMNIFTYTYMLYIPLLCALFGGTYFTLNSAYKSMLNGLDTVTPAISQHSANYADKLKTYLITRQLTGNDFSINSMKNHMVLYWMENPFFDNFDDDSGMGKVLNYMPQVVKNRMSLAVANIMSDKLVDKLADATHLNSELVRNIWNSDLIALAQGGLIVEVVKSQCDGYVRSLRKKLIIGFLILLSLPFLETGISKYLDTKALRKSQLST